VGEEFVTQVEVCLGQLAPEEVKVELYLGLLNPAGEIVAGRIVPMVVAGRTPTGDYLFEARSQCAMSGLHGCTVRILPYHPDAETSFVPGFIKWAE